MQQRVRPKVQKGPSQGLQFHRGTSQRLPHCGRQNLTMGRTGVQKIRVFFVSFFDGARLEALQPATLDFSQLHGLLIGAFVEVRVQTTPPFIGEPDEVVEQDECQCSDITTDNRRSEEEEVSNTAKAYYDHNPHTPRLRGDRSQTLLRNTITTSTNRHNAITEG